LIATIKQWTHQSTANAIQQSAKQISRKRLQKLIEQQITRDKQILQMQTTQEQFTTEKTPQLPAPSSLITYHHVPPKRYKAAIPSITQEEEDAHITTQHPFQHNSLPKFRQTAPSAISQEALYQIIVVGYINAPAMTVPRSLEASKLTIEPAIDIEELCSGAVYPMTQETITKYQNWPKTQSFRKYGPKQWQKNWIVLHKDLETRKGQAPSASYQEKKSNAS